MTVVPLAKTLAKLPRSIFIRANSDFSTLDFTTATVADIQAYLAAAKPLGAIERIDINQTIELKEWREFDSDAANAQGGQVVEWCPGKEEISFTLEGVILYTGDVLDRLYPPSSQLPGGIESMQMMVNGFAIEIIETRYPTMASSTVETRSTYLLGCRLSSHPLSINIGTADIIKQACEGKAARLMRTPWPSSGL